MILYILHNNLFSTYKLNIENDGDYLLTDKDDSNNKIDLVSIVVKDKKAIVYGNEDVQLVDAGNNVMNHTTIQPFSFFKLLIYNKETVYIYVSPSYDDTFVLKTINNNQTLTIGNTNDCDVIFSFYSNEPIKLNLTKTNDVWKYQNTYNNKYIYVNEKYLDDCLLTKGDSIFSFGLKIILVGNNGFLINNPNKQVIINENTISNASLNKIVANESKVHEVYADFYEEKDYFASPPRFKNSIHELKLNIVDPPSYQEKNTTSVLMNVIPSMLFSISSIITAYFSINSFKNKETNLESFLGTMAMCATLILASILWPFIERKYENMKNNRYNKKRNKAFEKYLSEKEQKLKEAILEQTNILKINNPSLEKCCEIIKSKNYSLFERGIDHDDFLQIRLGIGTKSLKAKITYNVQEFEMVHDTLRDKIEDLINNNNKVENVPMTISLLENKVLTFVSDKKNLKKNLNSLILQLITFHSYINLKLVILTSEKNQNLKSLKNLNHIWSNDREFRFYSENIEEGKDISNYLMNEYKSNKSEIKPPYYLIITDDIIKYKNLPIIKKVLDSENDKQEEKEKTNIGLIMFDSSISKIPEECTNFVSYENTNGTYFKSNMEKENMINFKIDYLDLDYELSDYCKILSDIPMQIELDKKSLIPKSLGFLEMYGVGKIEQLNIINNWENSNPVITLKTPIGVDGENNTIYLDLHETAHGPHGLIAGMTGSGKSEFIITFILSLAVSYSPLEVQFVLIDYKGGGLTGAFENRKTGKKLPHLVGTITNLDVSEMNRTLVSIESELKRRQALFNEAKEKLNTGTIDIYKYQKFYREGLLDIPLAHLFIISDEFAELKAQQPEFMDKLISTARIGRSLGVHLILATQKPTGVVDDQIWSNSKFRVCCKVQDVSDSKEMIKKPDAAYLKESGRFYLQVGYDEYFVCGQSAYTGSKYKPTTKIKKKIDNSINFVNNLGQKYKTIEQMEPLETTEDLGEELTNLLDAIIQAANEKNIVTSQLWLKNIPPKIYVDELRQKYKQQLSYCNINPIIGEYDNPSQQIQNVLTLNLTENGNCNIVGISGSGKSELLETLIYSVITSHSSDEIQIYVIDLGSETLKKFKNVPHVGDVLTISDVEKTKNLFNILTSELSKRKKLFSEYGGSYSSYISKTKSVFPSILVILNGLDVFKDTYSDIFDQQLSNLVMDSAKNGIYFVTTSLTVSTLNYKMETSFSNNLALKLLDPTDYTYMFGSQDNLILPSKYLGRGLVKIDNIYEFQSASISEDSELENKFNYVVTYLNTHMKTKVPNIPLMPNRVNFETLKHYITDYTKVPLGISYYTVSPFYYDFSINNITLTSGENQNDLNKFINSLCKIFNSIKDLNLIILDANEVVSFNQESNAKIYTDSFKKVVKALNDSINKIISNPTTNKYIVVVNGYSTINEYLKDDESEEQVITLDDLFELSQKTSQLNFVACDTINNLKSVTNKNWYDSNDNGRGIWIGEDIISQDIINCISNYDSIDSDLPNFKIAYVVENENKNLINIVQ